MNPVTGVIFHWLGGLAAGSFYVAFKGVRRWSWETAWLIGGIFSWLVAPWFFSLLNTEDTLAVLAETPPGTLAVTYLFGLLWGVGGLTFGLTMRYLGMSLGMAVALGYCTVFGTLIPPLFRGEFVDKLVAPAGGRLVLAGLVVCVIGIAIAGLAGKVKEGRLTDAEKRATIKDFHFKKGILVATFSGIMSACFAFGLTAGGPIAEISKAHGTAAIWSGLPALIVVMAGGFTTNFLWCVLLNIRNRTGYQYFSATPGRNSPAALELPAGPPLPFDGRRDPTPVPLLRNYAFASLAGLVWYFQFFFYSMGETKMGDYKFSSWTLHMASIIIFSSLWGIALKEWKGSGAKAKSLLFAGLAILVASTVIVGYGNHVGSGGGH